MNEDIGERLREAACVGDVNLVQKLLTQGADVKSKNAMNEWTALHWACKRNHVSVVRLLVANGAQADLTNKDGQIPAQLSSNEEIRTLLGASTSLPAVSSSLPITPSYLANPPFPYSTSNGDQSNHNNAASSSLGNISHRDSHVPQPALTSNSELVLKARLANSDDRDFIEIELERQSLSYASLLNLMCAELGVDKALVAKVRKLPDTVVRKDKDVGRLRDFQELELVLTNKAVSAASRTYSLGPARHTETILY